MAKFSFFLTVMFNVILVPFDTPPVVSYHSFVPLSLVALFFGFWYPDGILLLAHYSHRRNYPEIYLDGYKRMNPSTHNSAYVLYTF